VLIVLISKKIDASLYNYFKFISSAERTDFEGNTRKIFEKFSTQLSDKSRMPLKEGGDSISVNFQNRHEYVRLIEKIRLNESARQINAIRSGLIEVVPEAILNVMTWQDLEWRVCGKPFVDLNLLKRHTEYSGVPGDAPHIAYFWQCLSEFVQLDLRKFLRFTWGQERLPADDQEFARTQTRMLIKPALVNVDPNTVFPQADTCFFNLMLPEYSTLAICREKLLTAINTDADSMDADQPHDGDPNQNNLFNDYSDSDSE